MKKTIFFIILFGFLIIFPNIVKATTTLELQTDNSNLKKDETFSISIYVTGDAISSADLNIYYDSDKIEYVSGPDNSNLVDGKILYIWYSKAGNSHTDITLDSFTFKLKDNSTTKISIDGNCYNLDGTALETSFKELDLNLENNLEIDTGVTSSNVSTNNSYLKILRTNMEEIEPNFNKNTFEYFLTTTEDISNLNITAIPENNNSKVEIFGNNNFVYGRNTVEIKVTSEDNSETFSYYIYVTKTHDLDKSNTNLETLAIQDFALSPTFSPGFTNYAVTVDNSVENINILAIAENPNAKVSINKNDTLNIGNNSITITVTSEDKLTFKNYKVIAHRRTVEEQNQYETNLNSNAERLNALLNTVSENNVVNPISEDPIKEIVSDNSSFEEQSIKDSLENNRNFVFGIIAIVILVLIIGVGIWYFFRYCKINKNEK